MYLSRDCSSVINIKIPFLPFSILPNIYKILRGKKTIFNICIFFVVAFFLYISLNAQENARITPKVKAVSQAMPSTVFISSQQKEGALKVRAVKALGSGVVVEESGLILTNLHVVVEHSFLNVSFFNGNSYPCEILFKDERADLALLKLSETGGAKFPVMSFAFPGNLYLAESVLAIGAPQGLDFSVTEGIVSSLNRSLKEKQLIVHPRLIQVSVKANQGNSGGPVINMNGEMIGLLLAAKTTTQGIGFVLPVEQVNQQLRKWLSPEMQLGSELGFEVFTEINKKQKASAVVVKNSRKGTLNDLLGIKDHMTIIQVNGVEIRTSIDFYREILRNSAKSIFKLTLIDGSIQTAKLFELRGLKLAKARLGLSFEPNGQELARAVSMPFKQGYVISGVENISGYLSNIQKGDMLFKIGSKMILKDEDLTKVLNVIEKGDELPVIVLRPSGEDIETINDVIIVR